MITNFEDFLNESAMIDVSILKKAFKKSITHIVKAHEKLTEDHVLEFIVQFVFNNYGVDLAETKNMYKYVKAFVHHKFNRNENFTPIKINSHKPFKVKPNLHKSVLVLQERIRSLRKMLENEKNYKRRSEINKDLSVAIHKLKDLNIKKLKQVEYLRLNPIKENTENSENLDVILSTIVIDNPEKVLDYIGLDKDDYEVNTTYYDSRFPTNKAYNDSELEIILNHRTLENLMNIEENVIQYIQSLVSSYGNNNEYYVDDDELNYVHSYLTGRTFENVKKLAHIFDYQIDPEEEGEIKNFFEYLDLKSVLDDVKNEISMEHERAIEELAKDIIKKLPFEIGYSRDNKKDLELTFNYQEVIDYIQKYKLKVTTFKEFIEYVDADELDYGIDYSDGKYEYLGDFKDVDKKINETCEKYIDNPDEIFPKFIQSDNLELIKKKIDLANFFYRYKTYLDYDNQDLHLFEIAKHFNKTVLEWFKTYDFQKWFIEEYEHKVVEDVDKYKLLKHSEIIEPKIETEYEYLIDASRYNV